MKKLFLIILAFAFTSKAYTQFNENLYVFEENGKKGYVDNKLNVIIERAYDELGGITERFFGEYSIFKLNNKCGIIDTKGKQIFISDYNDLTYTSNPNFFIFEKNNKYGLVNNKGEEIIKPLYDWIELVNNGKTIILKQNYKYGLLNKTPQFKYDFLDGNINSNILRFEKDDKYGFINTKGKEIIPAQFDFVENFNDDYAIVLINDKYGIINKKGKLIIKPIYNEINYQYSFNPTPQLKVKEKIYYIKKDRKIGLLDKKLRTLIEPIYDEIGDYNEGLAYVKKDNKYGFINNKGKIVIPIEYEDADLFSEGLAPVVKNGKWGYVDIHNNVKIDFKFMGYANPFFNGLAVYRKRDFESSKAHYTNDKCGYIDLNGNITITPEYRDAYKFINGVAKTEGYYEYLIDKENNKFILKGGFKSQMPYID